MGRAGGTERRQPRQTRCGADGRRARVGATRSAAAAVALGCAAATAIAPSPALAGSGLIDVERRWIADGGAVLADARRQGLPLDVVVQPQPNRGEPPVALAWIAGRCKLVLTMRARDGDDRAVADPAPSSPTVLATFAHELGHCERHARGAWQVGPSGFSAPASAPAGGPGAVDPGIARARLEEGFADLYALGWIADHARAHYAAVHAWLVKERADPAHPGAEHDTGAWMAAAADPSTAFAGPGSLYERVERLWTRIAATDGAAPAAAVDRD